MVKIKFRVPDVAPNRAPIADRADAVHPGEELERETVGSASGQWHGSETGWYWTILVLLWPLKFAAMQGYHEAQNLISVWSVFEERNNDAVEVQQDRDVRVEPATNDSEGEGPQFPRRRNLRVVESGKLTHNPVPRKSPVE